MMLNTDMCLAYKSNPTTGGPGGGGPGGGGKTQTPPDQGDAGNNMGDPLLAHEHNCCAWLEVTNLNLNVGDQFCGGILEAG